jgi:predicted amidohydrolase
VSLRAALVSEAGAGAAAAVAAARAAGGGLVCLPHLSFMPWAPAVCDRAGLEHAERPPSRRWREALAAADGAWLAASAYESEGEGVFYCTARIGRAGGDPPAVTRQRHLEAAPGRWEQLLMQPGHEPPQLAALDGAGPAAALVGHDLHVPAAWEQAAALGARVVLGGASEPADVWERTCALATAMAGALSLTVLVANRAGTEDGVTFAGGGLAVGADGRVLATDDDGLVPLP